MFALRTCAAGALCLAVALPATAATHERTTIPDLTPWMSASDGKPTATTWKHAARFAIDNEIQPGRNAPAPVKTTVEVGYTKSALWLHFVARDPHPDDITVRYRRHDGFTNNDEYVGMIFSPFNDTQWGYEFFCSTGGTEMDQFRQQGHEYPSFDAIWYCNAHLTADGYTVTMQIPFRSLKFPHTSDPQTWRLVFFRNWARSVRHQITQIRLDYDSDCVLCQGQVVRTQTPIESTGHGLQIIPQATITRTDARADPASHLERGKPELAGGIDARWAVRPDLEWSATLNPNFSQIAPDVLQPTTNQRFAIFYPENRPFFEEGTWVFDTPGFNNDYRSDSELVDTRQIAHPHWATKLVGQLGHNVIGALAANDSISNILLPGRQGSTLKSFDFPTRDKLLRYRYDFPGNSAVGLLATDRRGAGYRNTMYAADGTWKIDASDTVSAQVARSGTDYPMPVAAQFGIRPGRVEGTGWMLSWQRTRRNYSASVRVARVAPGFRSDLGYLPQVGYREVRPHYEYNFYADDHWWWNGGFGASYDDQRATGSGRMLQRQAEVYAFVHAAAQSHVVLYARHQNQYFAGHAFTLDQYELDADAQPVPWLEFELDTTTGDGVDYVGVRRGRLLSIAPSAVLTPGRHLEVAFVGNFERFNLVAGRLYTARLYDLRLAWYFNSRMFVRAIGQEQDIRKNVALYPAHTSRREHTLATQFLFAYELNPWTSLSAGFANGYLGTGESGLVQQQRSVFLKLSYAFQF